MYTRVESGPAVIFFSSRLVSGEQDDAPVIRHVRVLIGCACSRSTNFRDHHLGKWGKYLRGSKDGSGQGTLTGLYKLFEEKVARMAPGDLLLSTTLFFLVGECGVDVPRLSIEANLNCRYQNPSARLDLCCTSNRSALSWTHRLPKWRLIQNKTQQSTRLGTRQRWPYCVICRR